MARFAHIIGWAFWGWACSVSLGAQNPPTTDGKKLPIRASTDRVFVPISAGKEPSHAWVGQIVEDRLGFLWFGTRDGLDRFDGYEVRHYSGELSGGENDVFVQECCRYSLFRGRKGAVWIGGDEALYRYDPDTERFQRMQLKHSDLQGLIRNINQDKFGTFWLSASKGLTRYDPENGATTRFSHHDNDPTSLGTNFVRATLETAEGAFWVATNMSVDLFDRVTGKVQEHFPLRNPLRSDTTTGNAYVRLLQDHTGVVWVASARDGLAFIDRAKNKLTFLSLTNEPGFECGAWAILEDEFGALWVGTEHGLLSLDRNRNQFVRYRNDPSDPDSLPADWILALYEDREGGIWAGTANAGVARFSAHPPPFRRYRWQGREPFGTSYVLFAYEDSGGDVWVGTKGAINQIDLRTGRYHARPTGENTEVASIIEDRTGQIWVGSFDGSLFRFDPATQRGFVYPHSRPRAPGCGNNEVRALFVDHAGTLWAASSNSVCSLAAGSDGFHEFKFGLEAAGEIDAVVEDRDGTLWVGARRGGLYRFDRTTGQFIPYRHLARDPGLSNDGITSLLIDSQGALWIGTLNGLNRMDIATGAITVYSTREGLPNSSINGIVEDARNDLWITTDYGLAHWRRSSNTFYNYYRSDGVFDDLTGAWKGRSGELFFGSYSGLTVLVPENLDENRNDATPVVLTSLRLSDVPVKVGANGPLTKSISTEGALTLSWQQSSFSFEFAALNYSEPERTRYRYRLKNLETGWNEVRSSERMARYTTVPPGRYVFEVEGRTSHEDWPARPSQINILVGPPWWDTTAFQIACAVFFGLLVWSAYRLRVTRVAHQIDLRYQERLRERTRIAQDLHDTLLQNIAGLCLQIGALYKVAATAPDSAREQLRELRRQGEECLREARQAVWDIRSFESSGADLISKLQESGEQLTRGTPTRFHIKVTGQSHILPLILHEQLLRIGREAIINAVHHANAECIHVYIVFEASLLQLTISDNGCGFELDEAASLSGHFGLITMRERAKKSGATIIISSAPGKGTSVQTTVRL